MLCWPGRELVCPPPDQSQREWLIGTRLRRRRRRRRRQWRARGERRGRNRGQQEEGLLPGAHAAQILEFVVSKFSVCNY